MNKLTWLLLDAGLLQFGRFEPDNAPLKLSLDMLPGYPDLLALIADQTRSWVAGADRLVCMNDSLPFGVALSLAARISLVYSRSTVENPTRDLVGGYDIGHPALLAANALYSAQAVEHFAASARKVGLQIDGVIAIIDCSETGIAGAKSLLHLPAVIDELAASGLLPSGHTRLVSEWLHKQSDTQTRLLL